MSPSPLYGIVIPTYQGHLEQVKLFLESFERFCLDKKNIPLLLVVSHSEVTQFTNVVVDFQGKLDIRVVSLREIIKKEERKNIEEEVLLKQIGKFNFQALKKIYGVKYANFNTALVLDSEALMVRPAQFKIIFEDYLKRPFVIYTPYFGNDMQQQVTYLSCQILGKQALNKWFLETQYWFFEKTDVDSMFSYVQKKTGKTVYQNFLKFIPLFPEIFYFVYLYYFKKKKYEFINADALLKKYLDFKTYILYRESMEQNTLFEYAAWGLSEEMLEAFTKMYNSLKLRFFKYDDRWQKAANTKAQQKFVKINEQIVLLPCRVVASEFKVKNVLVPKNHDEKSDSPVLSHSFSLFAYLRSMVAQVPLLKSAHLYGTHVIRTRTFKLQFTEISRLLDNDGSFRVVGGGSKRPVVNKQLAFDVGAFVGNSVDRIQSLGYSDIICFEPSPPNFVRLFTSHKKNKHIGFVWRAASDQPDKELTLFSDSFVPWLTTLHSDWLHNTRHSSDVNYVSKYTVKTTTLDSVIKRIGRIPGYIKIDTEGHEASVLSGLHYKPSLLSFEWISERKQQLFECLDHCERIGFKQYYLSLREAVPEFDFEKPLSLEEIKKYADKVCSFDQKNNLGGNVWCR